MSDRASLTLNYAVCDREAVEKVFGTPEIEDEEKGMVTAEFEEVDGGGCEELEDLAKAGVPCWGKHGAGYEYTEGYVACVRRRFRSMSAGLCDGTVCVDLDLDTDEVYGIKQAMSFARHWRTARMAVAKRAAKTNKKGKTE